MFLSAAVKQEVGTPVTESPCVPIILCAALVYKNLTVEQMPQVARVNRLTKFVKHSGLLGSRNAAVNSQLQQFFARTETVNCVLPLHDFICPTVTTRHRGLIIAPELILPHPCLISWKHLYAPPSLLHARLAL